MAWPTEAGSVARYGAALLRRPALPLSALAGAIAPEIYAAFPNRFDALRIYGSGSGTNLAPYSEQFDNGTWIKTDVAIAANSLADPATGNATADKMTEDGLNAAHVVQSSNITIVANSNYTVSVYVKANGRTKIKLEWAAASGTVTSSFDLSAVTNYANSVSGSGALNSATITAIGNDWYRISQAGKCDTVSVAAQLGIYLLNAAGSGIYVGDAVSGAYLWGAQVILGTAAGRYIQTLAASVTAGDGYVFAFPDEGANLGGFRSGNEWGVLATFGALERTTIERVAENIAAGVGVIDSDGTGKLRFTAPGSSMPGPYVAIDSGQVGILEDGADPSQALRVRRAGAALPAVSRAITLLEQYNNAYGQDNVADAEHTAGASQYRALILKNMSAGTIDLRIYLTQLGTPAALTAGYAAAGAIAPAGIFAGWPDSGFCENQNTGEVLYYTSRTDAALTVGASGRDVYAEVGGGAAGTLADTLYPISGLRFAREDPSAQPAGFIQTIANESAAPAGRTWLHPNSAKDPATLEIYGLASGNIVGLWLHRKVIAGASARALVLNSLTIDSFNWN